MKRAGRIIFLVLALWAFVGVLAMVFLSGCTAHGTGPTSVLVAPRTTFTAPTTVPSVSPSLRNATGYAGTAATKADDAYQTAAGLTAGNLDAAKPTLLGELSDVAVAIRGFTDAVVTAAEAARQNDAAVLRQSQEVKEARGLVTQREGELLAEKEAHAADNTKNAATIAKLQDDQHRAQVWWASVAMGLIVGLFVLESGTGWAIAAGAGIATFALFPFAIDAAQPWIRWGVPIGIVGTFVFILESKHKGGILPALHDRFIPTTQPAADPAAKGV